MWLWQERIPNLHPKSPFTFPLLIVQQSSKKSSFHFLNLIIAFWQTFYWSNTSATSGFFGSLPWCWRPEITFWLKTLKINSIPNLAIIQSSHVINYYCGDYGWYHPRINLLPQFCATVNHSFLYNPIGSSLNLPLLLLDSIRMLNFCCAGKKKFATKISQETTISKLS